jgi:hypothetical protein
MNKLDLKYFPISKSSETLSLDSPEFEKIKRAYIEDVLPTMEGVGFDLKEQAISLQKITLFFDKGKTRNRYIVMLLEPTCEEGKGNVPSPHLIISFVFAMELAGTMKIILADMSDDAICLCNQHESDMHLN